MLVFVLNLHKKPLMPCSPRKARVLLKEGKAKAVRRTPFTIKLLHGSSGYKQDLTAGVDTGSKVIGTGVVNEKGEFFYQAETMLRGEEIKKKMDTRRMYRRTRRGRKTRYRKPRFLNRKASTLLGRLPPSTKHKVEAHFREKKLIDSILPISKWRLELASFDIHAISTKFQVEPFLAGILFKVWVRLFGTLLPNCFLMGCLDNEVSDIALLSNAMHQSLRRCL